MDKVKNILDNLKDLYHRYYDQLLNWYRGLDDVSQFGVMAVAIVVIFFILVVFVLSKVVRR